MVDWTIARRVAGFATRSEDRVIDPGLDLLALAAEFEPRVSEYTRLTPVAPIPSPELVSRHGWADANLDAMAELMKPVEGRMKERFEKAGPLAGPLRAGAGAALATELGLVLGYMSQRVLGQYELSLIAGTANPRLLFVGANLVGAAKTLGVDREAFVRWVTVHELTHAMQFGGVPWLRDHMGGLLKEYLETVDVRLDGGAANDAAGADDQDPASPASPDAGHAPQTPPSSGARRRSGGLLGSALEKLRALDVPDPTELAERFRDGGLAALVQNDEQRDVMERMQAAMAVVEGHAEHVMDALAPDLVPQHEPLRAAMDARRQSRSAPERILMRLLGMEMKLRQYKLGKEFCDAVVAESGIEGLNRVWAGPEALPTLAEIERPADWLARQAAGENRLAAG
ncbi:MAG TPA: zinc-dependent metalloprotease [Thermoleophilaceae bacterium]|nr:zinc-dependent metalloprotease [Thermoleophilaceae bacterium]